MADGLWRERTVEPMTTREVIRRELEKEIIREEILAREIERRRWEILEAEMRRESILEREMTPMPRIGGFPLALGLGQPLRTCRYEYEPEMLSPFPVENRRVGMQFQEMYTEIRGFEAVPLQWRPPSPRIRTGTVDRSDNDKKYMIGLGRLAGSKRKPLSPRAPLKKEKFRCADCDIEASSSKGLEQHLSGRKHLAMRKNIKKGCNNGKKH